MRSTESITTEAVRESSRIPKVPLPSVFVGVGGHDGFTHLTLDDAEKHANEVLAIVAELRAEVTS